METIDTTTIPATGGSAARISLENDWRFAELIAATWVEPGLSSRYARTPDAVLAEFGILLAAGQPAPELPAATELDLVVEDFDGLGEVRPDVLWTYTAAPQSFPAVPAALATSLEASGA